MLHHAMPVSLSVLLLGCLDVSAKLVLPPSLASLPTQPRPGYYVAPGGSPTGDGSVGRPWDLATALSGGSGRVQPGDTIWLRGGSYRGAFRSTVQGAPGLPVVVRQYPGEQVTIDVAGATSSTIRGDAFVVQGSWTVWWGFELFSSDPNRNTTTRPNMIVNNASHTKYINLIVHDGGIGFYTYPTAVDVEVRGSVFYNNGWQGPARHQSHGIYLKSDGGGEPIRVVDNVLFNQFGYGIHAYSDPGTGRLNNLRLEGNVAFNNGTLAPNPSSANILVGGFEPADDVAVTGNWSYYSPGVVARNVHLGYNTLMNGTMSVTANAFVGGSPVLDVGYWAAASVTGNTLAGDALVVSLRNPVPVSHAWEGNRYYRDPTAPGWGFKTLRYAFDVWRTLTGLGATDQAGGSVPAEASVRIAADPYEPGRAIIAVHNWGKLGAVPVDLTGVLSPGDRYEVRSVQALIGAPLTSGLYSGGSVPLPMTSRPSPRPVGLSSSPAPRAGPVFDVFIVQRVEPR